MRRKLGLRFWLETGMAVSNSVLLGVTLIWNDWIERVFHSGVDNHDGLVEWLAVGASLVVAVTHFTLARCEWQRTQKASLHV
jgi:hypothetical protein